MTVKKVVVVGGGPAGMMAAIRAGQLGQDVTLVEKNASLGKKLLLSGKGRCNLTNMCERDEFMRRFSKNGLFLRDAFKHLFNTELFDFFEDNGLPLRVERQKRVFPATDRSSSILDILKSQLHKNGVKVLCGKKVSGILIKDKSVRGLEMSGSDTVFCDRLIVATGGVSYSFTGSTGEMLDIAKQLGHRIVPLRPGLVGLRTREHYPSSLRGLTLENIKITFKSQERKLISDVGELLFTEEGISGPIVLSLSSRVADWICKGAKVSAHIDIKPALSEDQMDSRLLREFRLSPSKSIGNIMKSLLPQRMIRLSVQICGMPYAKKANQVSQNERRKIIELLKGFRLDIIGTEDIEKAMVTSGGVSLSDIDPRTMQSRIVKGLFFAGEMIDVDGDTGGFNLQAAFSTGYLAGDSAAR